MVDNAVGKYERVFAQNCEDVLRALNIGYILRKAAAISNPQMEVIEEHAMWTIRTSTILKTIELKFKLNEPFEEVTPDGREVSSLVTVDGNKFICVQTAKKEGQRSTKSIREFTEDECTVTLEVIGTDIVSVQKFRKI